MSVTSPSDRGPINTGWLSVATKLADSVGPSGPASDAPHRKEARAIWRLEWLRRLLAREARPIAGSATDVATRLEIRALGGFRR